MIIAFTGAGISKGSGIDTFMERPEIRERLTRSFALHYPEAYRKVMRELYDSMLDKNPNDAHIALAEYDIDIITMNIDDLHEKAGSKPLKLHGSLPSFEELDYAQDLFNKPVLYGDMSPNYGKAIQKVSKLGSHDVLIVIGASQFTGIAVDLREIAYANNVWIIEIQENAELAVRERLEQLKEKGYL